MTAPELWVRTGGEIKVEKGPHPGRYLLRVKDATKAVTIHFQCSAVDLLELRKTIKQALK